MRLGLVPFDGFAGTVPAPVALCRLKTPLTCQPTEVVKRIAGHLNQVADRHDITGDGTRL